MASLNRIVILGNILDEPETKFSVEGVPMAKFGMPVSSGFNQAPSRIDIVCFRKLAETCGQFFRKGSNAIVEGHLQVRSFNDGSGNRTWVTEVIATNIQLADSLVQMAPKAAVENKAASEQPKENDGFSEVEELPEDDLPF